MWISILIRRWNIFGSSRRRRQNKEKDKLNKKELNSKDKGKSRNEIWIGLGRETNLN
jgi:hypothetical protein